MYFYYNIWLSSKSKEVNIMDKNVRNRIEIQLKRNNMTQKDLAEKLDVSEVTVCRWLSGDRDPSIETLNKIAEALGTTTSYFFIKDDWNNEKKPEDEKPGSIDWGKILAGTALTATAVIAIVALAKAMGKIDDDDKEQIEDILNRK